MKGSKLVTNKTIIDEYLDYQTQFEKKYGPKTIVLMEVGSFFEVYGVENDTEHIGRVSELSALLNVVKTKKNKNISTHDRKNPLMLGFPNFSLDKFLKILVENDNTVILIKQVTPSPNPERAITEILSKGTYLEGLGNEVVKNNMMAIYLESNLLYNTSIKLLTVSVSIIDLSTGENSIYEASSKREDSQYALDEIYRLIQIHQPREIAVYKMDSVEFTKESFKNQLEIHKSLLTFYDEIPAAYKKLDYQEEFLKKIFPKTGKLSVFEYLDIERMYHGRLSYMLLLQYAYEHDETIIKNLRKPTILLNEKHLILENNCVHQLNVTPNKYQINQKSKISCLLNILDETSTSLGKRMLHDRILNPIVNKDVLNQRYNLISQFSNLVETESETFVFQLFESDLKQIYDIERLQRRIELSRLQPCEFFNLDVSYSSVINMIEILKKLNVDKKCYDTLIPEVATLDSLNRFIKYYKNVFNLDVMSHHTLLTIDTNIFNKGIFKEIDDIQNDIDLINDTLNKLANRLSKKIDKEREFVTVKYTEKFGYYLSLTKNRAKILQKNIKGVKFTINGKTFSSKEFQYKYTTNGCRMSSDLIDSQSYKLISYLNKLKTVCVEKYNEVIQTIIEKYQTIFHKLVDFVAKIDFYKGASRLAIKNGYSMPKICEDDLDYSFVKAKDLRHPIIEKIDTSTEYVTNDIELGLDTKGILLYGVNASGKSSLMKSVGLNIIMAQAGMFVASSDFYYNPYHSIFTRIGNLDNIFKSQSTFEVEMSELRNIIKRANKNSLILGDELCSGTESISALAIVSTSIINLNTKMASLIFATHLHELANMKEIKSIDSVVAKHLNVRYDSETGKLYYDRKLKPGNGKTIYGLEVCKALDMPKEFIDMANEIRKNITGKSKFILDPKTKSVYNSSVFVSDCYICGNPAEDAHHIKFQCTADKNDMIGNIHKNHKSNLVPLCKPCHVKVHQGLIEIKGYVETTDGLELEYKKFDLKKLEGKKMKYTKQQVLKILELKCVPKITQKKAQIMLKNEKILVSNSTISKIWSGKYFS